MVDALYSTNRQPNFESHGGRLVAFDDGHCPETYHVDHHYHLSDDENNNNATSPRIVKYDNLCTATSSVHVYDNVLDPNIAHMLYNVTSSSSSSSSVATSSSSVMNDTDDEPSPSALVLEGESPWGTYVTMAEARRWIEWKANADEESIWSNDCCHFGDSYLGYTVAWKRRMLRYYNHCQEDIHHNDNDNEKRDSRDYNDHKQHHPRLDNMDNIRHALAVEAVASFLLEVVSNQSGTTAASLSMNNVDEKINTSTTTKTSTIYHQMEDIFEHAHGVAVWALSSKSGNSVSYHIDYAELLRYEYNVTVPPLWAGTIQCSPLIHANATIESNDCNCGKEVKETYEIMRGGEFGVNLGGLDHYAKHGYKGKCSGDIFGGWKRPNNDINKNTSHNIALHVNDHDQWVTIPYSFNRGIIHTGDLPHLSAPIDSISATTTNNVVTRVIVGFNVFGHDVGPHVAKAPEHSIQFRRKVKLYRSAINACSTKESKNSLGAACKSRGGGMDIKRIRQNKGLTKLLVLAKRDKVKEELRINQERLSTNIRKRLLWNHKHGKPLLCVTDLMNEFGAMNDKIDCAWPKSVDVHVHLHHMLLPANTSDNIFLYEDGVASQSETSYYCIVRAADVEGTHSPVGNSRCSLISLSTYLDVMKCTRDMNDRANND
jgi:hypothetical protein